MSILNCHIKHYECSLSLSAGDNAGPGATLYLYGDDHKLLAAIAFREEGEELAPARVQEDSGTVLGTLPISAFPRTMDVLRNERPVILCWDSAKASLRLTTGAEPVGEEESRRLFSWLYV